MTPLKKVPHAYLGMLRVPPISGRMSMLLLAVLLQ